MDTVTIPRAEFEALRAAAEELADLRAFDRAATALDIGDEDTIPADMVRRILAGESPVRVFRELRGLTQSRLAILSGVNRVQIADIEARRKTGSIDTARKLAAALGVTLDDLV